jgi:biopolymer transport protein ExbD
MKLTPLEKRAARHDRNKSLVDLNLVSLIDVFTILIFFLLSSATEVEILPSTKAVKLPQSVAQKNPKDTVVVVVSATDILVQGRKVADVAQVLASEGDLIDTLKAELELQSTKKVVRAENQQQSQTVTIMGDKDIPYRLLRKVMATCARANYSDISFAVNRRLES